MTDQVVDEPITLEDIADIVRVLAITTRDQSVRPHPASNLIQHSLIHQLRVNVVPDGDGMGGRSKPASERMPINAAAFTLYEFIVGRVSQLYEEGTDRRPKGSPEEMLVAWYVELAVQDAAGQVTQAQFDRLHDRLDDWRTRIMDLFYPPEREEIPYACPECGWKHITRATPEGEVRQYALVGIERPWRDEEGVKCRGCNTVWLGKDSMLELAADLGVDLKKKKALAAEPAVDPEPPPLWLLAMTHDQAKEFARDRGIDKAHIVIASGPLRRLRHSQGPVRIATSDTYDPGIHEAARVAEAVRIAQLVNTMNGYDPTGQTVAEQAS